MRAVGLASANMDTQLAAIAGYIDTEVRDPTVNAHRPPCKMPINVAAPGAW